MRYLISTIIFILLFHSKVLACDTLVCQTNEIRFENHVGILLEDPRLDASAEKKACDLLKNNYWAHNRPDGKTPWSFIKESGYKYVYAGENLAKNYSEKEVLGAFMKSPSHKKNMLSKNYQDLGIGECGNIIVFHFGSTKGGDK